MTDNDFISALEIASKNNPVLQSYRNRTILKCVNKKTNQFIKSTSKCPLRVSEFSKLVGNEYAGFDWVASQSAVCCGKMFSVTCDGKVLLRRVDDKHGSQWSPVLLLPGAKNTDKWRESSVVFSRVDMMFCFELSEEEHSVNDRITQIVSSADHLIIKINDDEKSVTHIYRYFAGTRRRCKKRLDASLILPFAVSSLVVDGTDSNDQVLVSPSCVIYYRKIKDTDDCVHVHLFGDKVSPASRLLSINPLISSDDRSTAFRFKWIATGQVFTIYHCMENATVLKHLIKIPLNCNGYWFDIPDTVSTFYSFKPMYVWNNAVPKKWPEIKEVFSACPNTINTLTRLKASGWTRPHWPATAFISQVNGKTKMLIGNLTQNFSAGNDVAQLGDEENEKILGIERASDTCDMDERILIRGNKTTVLQLGKQTIITLPQDPMIKYHVDWESDTIYVQKL